LRGGGEVLAGLHTHIHTYIHILIYILCTITYLQGKGVARGGGEVLAGHCGEHVIRHMYHNNRHTYTAYTHNNTYDAYYNDTYDTNDTYDAYLPVGRRCRKTSELAWRG
jgi:hypothetical protein